MRAKTTVKGILRWAERLPKDTVDTGCIRELTLCIETLEGTEVLMRWPWAVLAQPDVWAPSVSDAAQDDCDERGTVCTYRLQLVERSADPMARADERPLATKTLRREPCESTKLEEASLVGIVSQLMRHNEAAARANAQLLAQASQQSLAMTSVILDRLTALERERGASMEMMREALVAQSVAVTTDEENARRDELTAKMLKVAEPIATAAAIHVGKMLTPGTTKLKEVK
ncbi:MAG: hypothetical protein GY953_46955 [bacterium]|nr:hypothetical protein [bacterium]